MNQTIIDTIAPRLTELVIKKIETLTGDWQKPWIADMTHGLPRNLRGTPYRAGNVLMLLFLSEIMGYGTPVFMTFKQAKEEGLNIRKGSDAFPVYFWKMYVRHKETRKKIESAEYYRLPKEQQKHYDLIPVMRYYPVFYPKFRIKSPTVRDIPTGSAGSKKAVTEMRTMPARSWSPSLRRLCAGHCWASPRRPARRMPPT